jgi:hypothetical protein
MHLFLFFLSPVIPVLAVPLLFDMAPSNRYNKALEAV